ncbi:MAG TPA: TPM domain-containing protein [Woeseiaceae bacterium]|nr:TPM domain-containing protein [Woeseiaceae bacterium]
MATGSPRAPGRRPLPVLPGIPHLKALLLLLLSVAGIAAAEDGPAAVPALNARVTDLTGTLDAAETARLDDQLAELESSTGAQLAVLVVASTRPEAIEQYAIRVADAWRLGREGVDDGVLLLVATEDRAVRIEVGYGLEGAVPDARANRIIDEQILPRFREGDYAGGLAAGTEALAAAIRGESLPPPAPRGPSLPDVGGLLPVLLVLAATVGGALKRAFGALPGAALAGGLVGALVWFLVGVLVTAIVAAAVAFVLILFMSAGPGAWSSGRGYGGGFGGGFGRGGGFGGGGGSFGGGGASGRW